MKSRLQPSQQGNFLLPELRSQLDPRQGLYKLAERIDWEVYEEAFGHLYSEEGRPALPIRRMVGLLLLKYLHNLSDERVVEFWSLSPYAQYFCGEEQMQWGPPCEASELTHFRNRIGPGGAEKIFSSSISLHGEKALEKEVVVDTTTQAVTDAKQRPGKQKNITFPTDTKLAAKIVKTGVKLARRNNLALRQSYVRTLPKLLLAQRGRRSKNGALRAKKATRKLKTIAWRVVRQLDHSLPPESPDRRWLSMATRVLSQKRKDSKKIYSLHEPHVYCLSKGKEHKRYEFGAKASVLVGKQGGVILGAYSLPENDYDGHSLGEALAQVKRLCGYSPSLAIADRGYRGRTHWGETELITPKAPKKSDSAHQRRKARARFRRRAAIEPRIGHLKSDFRLGRNFLKGQQGDSINLLLAATAANLSLWMRKILSALVQILSQIPLHIPIPISPPLQRAF